MTTQGENALLTQIAADITMVKVTLARVDENLTQTTAGVADHEARLRVLEASYIKAAAVRWWVTIAAASSGAVVYLVQRH